MKHFVSVVSVLFILEGMKSSKSDKSVIILSSSSAIDDNYLVKNVDDFLELTCMSSVNQSVGWVVPNHLKNRVLYSPGVDGSSTVTIKHLLVNDSGEFMCGVQDVSCSLDGKCTNDNYSSSATIHLYVKKRICLGFQCNPTICISERFICDGKFDCPNKKDEALNLCGLDPCVNKIKCNGRCIPQEWCCVNVENCTRKWDINCCPNSESSFPDSRIMRYLGSPQHYNDHHYNQYNNSNITFFHRNLSDYSFLQNFIHTVRGYTLVLCVIGPIIVIGVCGVYMRHRSYQPCQQGSAIFFAPRTIPQRYHNVEAVAYHPPPHIEAVGNEELHSLAVDPGETLEQNNDAGIIYNNFGNTQPDEPPPYYEAIYPYQDDDQPPSYSSAIDSCDGDKLASV